MRFKRTLYVGARTLVTAACICGFTSVTTFTLDFSKSLLDHYQGRVPFDETYHEYGILRAPFETPITDYALPISAAIGGLSGLAVGISDVVRGKKLEEVKW